MSQRVSRGRLEALEAACRRHGLPLTVQRRVVLEALAGRTDHPTADQLLVDVRTRLPDLSRTTVYRVLETLVRLGLAVKTCTPGSAVRFDPRTERHHHLVCLRCDRVMDLHAPSLDRLRLSTVKASGFEISDYSVHFRGTCPECRRREGVPAASAGRRAPLGRGSR
jgi:Fur family peroxide stress response transcriptional regulator